MTWTPESAGCRCAACPLSTSRVGPPVPPEFPANPRALVIGEAPGKDEVAEGRPFVGASGIELFRCLRAVGVQRSQIAISNALLCRPPDNDLSRLLHRLQQQNKARAKRGEPKIPTPIECCRPRLLVELAAVPRVVTLGATAYEAVSGAHAPILSIRGGPKELTIQGRAEEKETSPDSSSPAIPLLHLRVLPTLHPAFVMRSRRWLSAFRVDLGRAFRWFKSGLAWRDPIQLSAPHPSQLRAWLAAARGHPFTTCDLETFPGFPEVGHYDPLYDRIGMVGIGTADGRHAVAIPFRSIETGGGSGGFYTQAEQQELIEILKEYFTSGNWPIAGHNFNYYDRMVIENRLRIKLTEKRLDTIALHKLAEPELPHGLGYVGSIHTDVDNWKAGHLATEATTDAEWWAYNCLAAGTPVVLADGSTRPIEALVRARFSGEVRTIDERGRRCTRRVVGWSRSRVKDQPWLCIRTAATQRDERGLILTPDHRVWTERGWVEAQALRPGVDRIAIDEPALTSYQRAAFLGTLLGDSSLVPSPSFRGEPLEAAARCALQGGHATASGLAQYKIGPLAPFLTAAPPRPISGFSAGSGRTMTLISTRMLAQLRELVPMLYDRQGRRLLPSTLDVLGPVGLAWWFMDDGCLQKGGRKKDSVTIAACRYPRMDQEAACAWFRTYFGPTWIGADGVIRLGAAAAERFAIEIAPHVPEIMRYKLPRGITLPAFVPPPPASERAAWSVITAVDLFHPLRGSRQRDLRAETRYCLTVEGEESFFTSTGLVHNSKDLAVTALCLPGLVQAVKARGQEHLAPIVAKLQSICVGLHTTGLYVDEAKRLAWDAKLIDEARTALTECRQRSGRKDLNPGSTAQLRDLLFDELQIPSHHPTALGDPSTDDDSLRAFLSETWGLPPDQRALIQAIRTYRKKIKMRGTYVTKLRDIRDVNVPVPILAWDEEETEEERQRRLKRQNTTSPGLRLPDGRFHPDYNAHGTVGWRLSSSSPNAQNFPNLLRDMVIAAPGNVLVGCDEAQLELRMLAGLAGAAVYLEAFSKREDPHYALCLDFFGDTFKAAGKDQKKALRRFVKEFTYASAYMAGPETVQQVLTSSEDENGKLLYPNLTIRETAAFHDKWIRRNPEIETWWESTIECYRKHGYLLDPIFGLRVDFLDGEKPNELVNFPCQSGGAALVHLATFDVLEQIPFEKWGPGTGLVNQAHDALVVECPEAEGERVKEILEESMKVHGKKWGLDLPFLGEGKAGRTWKDV